MSLLSTRHIGLDPVLRILRVQVTADRTFSSVIFRLQTHVPSGTFPASVFSHARTFRIIQYTDYAKPKRFL